MKKTILAILILSAGLTACKKDSDSPEDNFDSLKTTVLADFTNIVALPTYQQLNNKAIYFNTTIQSLNNNATEANLTAAKEAWKDMRSTWEQSEGFLFGPVEDNDYDPHMDTWPTDYVQMDSLMNSANPLTLTYIQALTLSLRGYHPLEYILFGNHGSRTAASITERQKTYMLSLTTDLQQTCEALYQSWSAAPVNYANQIINAGNGSTIYSTKKDAYLAIVGAMVAICEEVGEGKMKEPFDAMDPNLVESPYSGNSIADFKNNIIGLQNVYLSRMGNTTGKGISNLVASKNISLDNQIKNQIQTAINSFDNISMFYEDAIIHQRPLCQQTMTALGTLKNTLENQLLPFIIQYIND
ncbi:MAG: hypothetical protein IT254_07500 [Chitinophagaceae bacterium]|nr:hypothetical protein [Bacteroidota bacterium]MCC6258148.1 hypothetical protein [Chitinophagaceae bacterium]MCW5917360.1 hypothetical protein [Ferruginibacter sp.]